MNELARVESRQHKDIKEVLKSWGEHILSQIKELSIDLFGNYRGLGRKVLPNADIVADRFDAIKLVNEELNRAKNAEERAINKVKNKAKQEQLQGVINQSKYALLKLEDRLTQKQKIKFAEVKQALTKLAEMHRQKESFRTVFEKALHIGQTEYSIPI